MIITTIVLLILGLLILIKGADWLVDGASSLAAKYKINPIIIGLTIVAFGTSTPELVVSVTGALSGNESLSLGNIIGSNISNILLILGISSIINPLTVNKNTVWKEIPMSFLGGAVMTILGLKNILNNNNFSNLTLNSKEPIGALEFSDGLIFLSFFVIFLYYTFGIAKPDADVSPEIKPKPMLSSYLLIVLGLFGLTLGSKLFVDNAVIIAKLIGVSEMFIGLTIVAIGTSLPELATNIVAASKKKVEIAIGNVVGSNIFNIFFVLGASSIVAPLPLTGENLLDIFMLFFATMLLFATLFINKKHCITRQEGVAMISIYIIYIAFLILRE
jgi:cation:H+ antiporter